MCDLNVQHLDVRAFNVKRGLVLMFPDGATDALGDAIRPANTPFVVQSVDRDSDNEVNLVSGVWLVPTTLPAPRVAGPRRLFLSWGRANNNAPVVGVTIDPDGLHGGDAMDLGVDTIGDWSIEV